MQSKKNFDLPGTFLERLGKMLSLRDRERLRRVSTKWNAAFLSIAPSVRLPIRSVTVQDEMIAFETGKISRRFYFRNDKMIFFNIGRSSANIDRILPRHAFIQFAQFVSHIPRLRINISHCSCASILLEMFVENCAHWICPQVIARSWCASVEVCNLLSLFARSIVVLNLHRNSSRRSVKRICDHANFYAERATEFSDLLCSMSSLQVFFFNFCEQINHH
ncbi:unnamed protein product [Toxocara canis]|uniref:F-box domain-containing protein n=1 Tax=Toxocara canis TaxID=6265 RepID=A0A183VDX1_TOXCA|nr:unnamed protein product [Toxocara canis]